MVIWIIVGSLVAIVAVFLVVMSIRDRKKMKIEKVKADEIEKLREEARENVVLYLKLVIDENEKLLKNFIPSVGKLKMGDIRAKAKKALINFKNQEEFKFAKDSEANSKLIETYKKFEKENSNVWLKHLEKNIKELNEEYIKIDKNFIKRYKPVAKIVKEAYK